MSWLALLKKQTTSEPDATKPTKPQEDVLGGGFVGFVACPSEPIQKNKPVEAAANDTPAETLAANPDRCCWPQSDAMNGQEIDTFMGRLALFTDKGLSQDEAERLADKLVVRDRESDDRRLCLECVHLQGHGRWRCGNWSAAGVAQSGLASELAKTLQRCNGYPAATNLRP